MQEIIDRSVYLTLTPEEQKKYVLITPTAEDKELAASIDSMADAQKILEMLEPLQAKAIMLPNPLPGEQLDALMTQIEAMVKLLDPIEALTKVPIIGQLAAPIVNLINKVFMVIGMLLMLISMVSKGQELFTDSICKAVDELDWDGLKEAMDIYKKKMEDMKQKVKDTFSSDEETEETENEDGIMRKTVDAGKQVLDYAGNEINKQIDEVKKAANTIYESVEAANIGARTIKLLKETQLQNYSWLSMSLKLIKVASLLGVDFSLLNQPTEEQMDAFEKMFPNPSAQVQKANKVINKLGSNKKYAKIVEKKVVVDTEKKIVTTPPIRLTNQLSPHFTLSQLCYSDTARSKGINNNNPPAYVVENLRLLCENILEPIYEKFGPPKINSGYRCPRLNEAVGGSSTSQHAYGQAVDIEIIGVANYKLAMWIKENLKYNQLILEECKNPNDINDGWVHVSYNLGQRKKDNSLLTYAYSSPLPGIVPPPYRRLA